jgi:hypothetical protein
MSGQTQSFNEIEGSAYKAARGAGFAWGLAEEAAFAARWLAERDFAWLPAFLAVCEARLGQGAGHVQVSGSVVAPEADTQTLCPIHLGAWIADKGEIGSGTEIHRLRQPVLLLPFLDLASRHCGPVVLSIGSAPGGTAQTFKVCRGQLRADPRREGLPAIANASVNLGAGTAVDENVGLLARPGPLDPVLHARLAALEMRTYVAASQHSRLAGAGAGLTDND